MPRELKTSEGMIWLLQSAAAGMGIQSDEWCEKPIPKSQWPEVLSLITWHRLGPAILEGKRKAALNSIPEPWNENLRALVGEGTRKNFLLCQELLTIHQRFTGAQIPYLVLKGLPLAMQAFGNLGSRLGRDIDLLIAPDDYEKAVEVLVNLGFSHRLPVFPYPPPLRWTYTAGEVWEKDQVLLDLHCSLHEPGSPFEVDIQKAMASPTQVKIANAFLPVLPPEIKFLYLANHAAKHLWMRFFWLADLIGLCQRTTLNWQLLLEEAKRLRMERRLWMSLLLASDLFGWKIPDQAKPLGESLGEMNALRERWRAFSLENRGYARSLVLQNPPLRVFRWSTRLTDRFQDRLKLMVAWIFRPLSADVMSLRLPRKLRFLYRLWRPIRLVGKLFRR